MICIIFITGKLISDTWCTVDSGIVMLEETTHQNRKVSRTLLRVDANHARKMFVYPYCNQVCSTLLVQAVHALTAYKEHDDDSSDRVSFLLYVMRGLSTETFLEYPSHTHLIVGLCF